MESTTPNKPEPGAFSLFVSDMETRSTEPGAGPDYSADPGQAAGVVEQSQQQAPQQEQGPRMTM